jgi:hypothetical protein
MVKMAKLVVFGNCSAVDCFTKNFEKSIVGTIEAFNMAVCVRNDKYSDIQRGLAWVEAVDAKALDGSPEA